MMRLRILSALLILTLAWRLLGVFHRDSVGKGAGQGPRQDLSPAEAFPIGDPRRLAQQHHQQEQGQSVGEASHPPTWDPPAGDHRPRAAAEALPQLQGTRGQPWPVGPGHGHRPVGAKFPIPHHQPETDAWHAAPRSGLESAEQQPDSPPDAIQTGAADGMQEATGMTSRQSQPGGIFLNGEPHYVWVFHNSDGGYKYNHMATSEVVPWVGLVVAWQRGRIAEGYNDQELVWSTSQDNGDTWTVPEAVPGRQAGIMWTPSLFRPKDGSLHLFYTESRGCWWCESPACFRYHCQAGAANCDRTVPFGSATLNLMKLSKSTPRRQLATTGRRGPGRAKQLAKSAGDDRDSINWRAGGDLKIVTASVENGRLLWGQPREVLSEQEAGPVPKVIANPPVVDPLTGRWVLPYWRETPRGEVVCPTKATGGDYASVLTSQDRGVTWESQEPITMPNPWKNLTKPDWLIEGTIAPSADGLQLLQLFRTSREVAYMARSTDGGVSWLPAQATSLKNPNAKMNVLRMSTGALVAAYNAHGSEQIKRRSLLTVSVSTDDGSTWRELKVIESRLKQELRFHYPMLREMGCDLLLTYSVMTPPKSEEPGGIRLVKLPVCHGRMSSSCPCTDGMSGFSEMIVDFNISNGKASTCYVAAGQL